MFVGKWGAFWFFFLIAIVAVGFYYSGYQDGLRSWQVIDTSK